MTVSLRWSTASRGRKPVAVVFGTGGHLGLALVVWSWRGLVARLSICPLENSPVLLESIMAPVEEIAITISDGREGERQEPHPFLEYDQTYDWNIFTKRHHTNVLLIPSVWFLIVSGFLYTSFSLSFCQIARGGCTFKDIIKLWMVLPVPVFYETHQASAGTWQRSAEKNLLPFKSSIAAFCDRLDLEWAKPAPAGGCSPFGLSPELFLLWYVWLTCSMGDW